MSFNMLVKRYFLLHSIIAYVATEHAAKAIAMKSSGNLPGCTGRIAYVADANVNPAMKTSVFRITEAVSSDECAHLCYTHYFCRSSGFEPNNRVETGGLCYLAYKESKNCTGANAASQRVTDYQTNEPVWLDCDLCTDPLPSNFITSNDITSNKVQLIDEDFKESKTDEKQRQNNDTLRAVQIIIASDNATDAVLVENATLVIADNKFGIFFNVTQNGTDVTVTDEITSVPEFGGNNEAEEENSGAD